MPDTNLDRQSHITKIAQIADSLSEAIAECRLADYTAFNDLNQEIFDITELNLGDLESLLTYLTNLNLN